MERYIKRERPCLTKFPNASKFPITTPLLVVFSPFFLMFVNAVKHVRSRNFWSHPLFGENLRRFCNDPEGLSRESFDIWCRTSDKKNLPDLGHDQFYLLLVMISRYFKYEPHNVGKFNTLCNFNLFPRFKNGFTCNLNSKARK